VKIAVSSASFAVALREGALTHLEWLEGCASRLAADGVVFALGDLPRTDAEYAAQVRKVSTDLGLVPVALDVPGLLDPAASDDSRTTALALAVELGAGLIRGTTGRAGELPPKSFVQTVEVAKALAKAAKAANVTVVVAAVPGSVSADLAELRHLLKDVDSAWLRYEAGVAEDRTMLGPRDRVLIERVPLNVDPAGIDLGRRAWYVLGGDGGADPFARVAAAVRGLRETEARRLLAGALS
jgi:hypothetical protein